MRKLTPATGKAEKNQSGATPRLFVRMASADRETLARAAALRGASESEYVRLIVLAAAKRDIAASLRQK